MAYDLLIRGGTVIDGTGADRFIADVAVKDDKIAAVGQVAGDAARIIDATGKVVTPGFIDPHTPYDAQMSWDPLVTPTSWHGITTTVIGNCGVGLAPCRPEFREHALWDLINVEAMSKEVLEAGIEWQWESFGQFIDATLKRGSAINVGFLVPLSPLRTFVMGDAASQRAATPEETDQICALLDEAVAAGALGFSSSQQPNHIGYQGKPLASRLTSDEEFAAYARTMGKRGRGGIEIAVTKSLATLADDEVDLLEMLADESGRPVTWLTLLDLNANPGIALTSVAKTDRIVDKGVHPQTVVRPFLAEADIHNPFMFAPLPAWKAAFNQSRAAQKQLYSDAAFRRQFRDDMANARSLVRDWDHFEVLEVQNPDLRPLISKTISQIADERGTHPADTFLDIAVQDDIHVRFRVAVANSTEENLIQMITDPRIRIGLGDGGAHVDMLCEAGYTTYLLGHWVRERGIMSLERAVQRITSEAAALFDIRGRGTLAEGMAADIVVFDADQIGSDRRPHLVHDLPAGGKRMIAEARGVDYTIVNGQLVFDQGRHSGALPGQAAN
ncbi:MAG: amidohydrolase family protein [Pseudomonadota bacterium]|nr:amidohydrolase family protein [Pseudomonadota bacterium]